MCPVAIAIAHAHLLVAALQNCLPRLGRKLAPRGVHVEAQRPPSPAIIRVKYSALWLIDHGATAPRPTSGPGRAPPVRGRPPCGCPAAAFRQALYGELNENDRGSRSPTASGWPLQASSRRSAARGAGGRPGRRSRGRRSRRRGSARFHRVGEPPLGAGLDRQPVDHHLDVVLLPASSVWRVGQRMHHTVDPDPAVALGVQLVEEVDELALRVRTTGRGPGTRALLQATWSTICCGSGARCARRRPGQWGAGPGVQKTQIVVHPVMVPTVERGCGWWTSGRSTRRARDPR